MEPLVRICAGDLGHDAGRATNDLPLNQLAYGRLIIQLCPSVSLGNFGGDPPGLP
jgi:hypothetical protein